MKNCGTRVVIPLCTDPLSQAVVQAAQTERVVSIDTICSDIEALHSAEEDGLTVDDKARITSLLFQLV